MSYFFSYASLLDIVDSRLQNYQKKHRILTKEAFNQFETWLNSTSQKTQIIKSRIMHPRNQAIDFLCISLENSENEITVFCSIIKSFIPILLGIYIVPRNLNFNVLNRVLYLIQEFFKIAETHDDRNRKIESIHQTYNAWKDRNVDYLQSLCSVKRVDTREAILNGLLLYGL